ncbi:MAG: hypothetical protein HY313_02455 [Acidobacteria bacterium]|nr:hypothetical protein [Acidobacteriota bacterium]
MTPYRNVGSLQPRRQAGLLVERITPEGSVFHGVLLGKRREGKTDLLRQVHTRLFETPEGPITFFYAFPDGQDGVTLARHFLASFCQQVRAFLMRREELLWEPAAHLEQELERPGLPFSLTELIQSFLALPQGAHAEFAAALPAQFANREKRPVCLLLDDAEKLSRHSPFFSALNSPDLCWLLTGHQPFLQRLGGEQVWPLLPLEPFSPLEAQGVAEKKCREADLAFSEQVWEEWFEIAGTSPWLIAGLINSAATSQQPIESLEKLGRIYIQELAYGTLGNALAIRWQRAIPDRRHRLRVAEFLVNLVSKGLSRPDLSFFSSEIWDGLVAEEWAEETGAGLQIRLSILEQDWLWLSLMMATSDASAERAQSRALQTFLLRAAKNRRDRQASLLLAIREKILRVPQTGWPGILEWEGLQIRMPEICSVAVESAKAAELFWCYGFLAFGPEKEPCVFLIALCEEAPSREEIHVWRQQLEREARLLPATPSSPTASKERQGSLPELWVVLPQGASLVSEGAEHRFSWETFFSFLESGRELKRSLASHSPLVD